MLTIRAMAAMGPWTLLHIDVLDGRDESCERCGTSIRYVWVMEVKRDGAPAGVSRIGSECGPKLEGMSAEMWKDGMKPAQGRLKLALRIQALMSLAAFGVGGEASSAKILVDRLPLLLDGTLPDPKFKHLRLVVGSMEKRLLPR